MTASGTGASGHGIGRGQNVGDVTPAAHLKFVAARCGIVRFCRVADGDWRLDRVYFLAFLNPSR